MLEVKNIYAGYGKKQVLYNISENIEQGKITAIIGPNGSGKSTLLKSAAGLIPLIKGEIIADATPLSKMNRKAVGKKIAYLSQSKSVADMTVGQAVLHGRFPHLSYPRRYSEKDREIALASMKKLGIEHLSGNPLYSLSGGMRQNAYIAMVLTQNTDYILMDEPAANLDIANSFKLMDVLKALVREGKGIVCVMHDLALTMEYADKIVVLCEGRKVMSGSPEDIYSSHITQDIFGVEMCRAESEKGFSYYYGKK